MIAFAFLDKKANKINEKIATMRPNAVVINASEIPPDRVFTSPEPKTVINNY